MLQFGPFTLDPARCELRKNGHPVHLERKVFELLLHLIEHRDRIVPTRELLDRIWSGTTVSIASVRRTATLLRSALEDDTHAPRWIATVHGRGYRFVGSMEAAPGLPPHAAHATSDYRRLLLGRAAEQRLLGEALTAAKGGVGSLLLLEGEAGIGKSRLLEWCVEHASSLGALALHSHCREEEGAPPLWPWIQIVRRIAALQEAWPSGEKGRHIAPALAQLFPELHRLVQSSELLPDDPRALRFQAYEGLLELLRDLSARHPLVLIFDDLHRADSSSLGLLEFLASQGSDLHALFIGSMRPEGATALARLARGTRCRILSLKGLAEQHVRSLLAAAAPELSSERLAAQIWQQTGGNPFFIHQVLSLAVTAPEIADASGSLARVLPSTVRSAIEQQCGALSPDALTAMRGAAVLGREFSGALLAEVLEQPEAATFAALDEGVHARLLEEAPERPLHYRYVHLLVRDVLYQSLGAHARTQLHWRVGTVLEARSSDAENLAAELAYHFSAAGTPTGIQRAIGYHEKAGRVAADRFDYAASIRHYHDALQLLEALPDARPKQRCDLLLAQARQSLRAGFSENAGELWIRAAEQARAMSDPDRLCRAALELASGFDAHGHVLGIAVASKAVALLEDAIGQTDPARKLERARLFARLTHVLEFLARTEDADRIAEMAWALAQETEDPLAMAEALTFQHRRLLGTPQAAVRVRIAAELIRHAERAGDHGLQLAYRVAHAADLVELGRFDEWEASATEHARLAERLKSPEDSALAHRNRAMRLLMQGRFSEARAFAQRGAVVAQHCEPRVLLELGQVAVAIEAETVGVSASLLNRFQLGGTGWESPRLWVLCQMDRADLAREGLPSVLDRLRLRPRSSSWHASAAILADVIVHLDDTESATEVLEWLRGFESLHAAGGVGGVYMGPVRRSIGRLQGIVGCCDDAVDSLEQGLRDMQALGAVPWVSRIHLDLAECYARRRKLGDRDRAAAHAHTGTRLAKQYGMADLERRGRQLLAAVPARLGRVAD